MIRKGFGACAVLVMLLFAAGSAAQAQGDDGLLPVEQAFALKAHVAKPGVVALDWTIAPHYYLYRGRIKVSTDSAGVTLGEPVLPAGEKEHDEYLGDVEIYHGALHATVPYTAGGARTVKLAVRFQGCHEVDPKICYPPHTQVFELALPATAATAMPAATAAQPAGGLGGALGRLGGPAGQFGASGVGEPLPPAQAFRFDAIAAGPTSLMLRWVMPPHYYLYRDKTTVSLVDADGVSLGTPQWPRGVQHTDENFGTTEVYFGELDLTVPLQRSDGAARSIVVQTSYQGCQEDGICYPVMTRSVPVALPAATPAQLAASAQAPPSASAASAANAAGMAPPPAAGGNDINAGQDRLSRILRGSSLWLVLGAFFLAGLGLAFTPCVYPMLPILTGLIAGAGEHLSTGRATVLSLVYILANAVVFAIAGIVAGLLGFNVTAWFQQPWLLSLFAL
ncbi:MAG TPA: protein-disulfide reductase DsbD domain-containing protein, partial [Rhodanobacteraceae bacterium]|nr:protein-disulfide reductase DsbD domain-containing protein [Rhodanobacteraceae bacterium]